MKLGIIGCGKMATALIDGALAAHVLEAKNIIVGAADRESSQTFATERNLHTGSISEASAVLIAVKPAQISSVLEELSPKNQLIISIAAGVTIETIENAAPGNRIIRVMPNTPSLVGRGASGYSASDDATDTDISFVHQLLSAVGIAEKVPENLLDAVTGVSGSGPAYIYMVIEALADGGVRNGLPRDIALRLATQTVLGSAEMVKATNDHPAVLKDQVTSPGGTTIAAVEALEAGNLRATLINAVTTATKRATELGA